MSETLFETLMEARDAIVAIKPANHRQHQLITHLRDDLNSFLPQMDKALDPEHDWRPFMAPEGVVQAAKCAKCETVRLRDIFDRDYIYAIPNGHGDFTIARGTEQPCGASEP